MTLFILTTQEDVINSKAIRCMSRESAEQFVAANKIKGDVIISEEEPVYVYEMAFYNPFSRLKAFRGSFPKSYLKEQKEEFLKDETLIGKETICLSERRIKTSIWSASKKLVLEYNKYTIK